MRISDQQIQTILHNGGVSLFETESGFATSPRETDAEMIKEITTKIMDMPDREDMIQDIKARIEAGTYQPSSEDIADSMVRRAIADRIH